MSVPSYEPELLDDDGGSLDPQFVRRFLANLLRFKWLLVLGVALSLVGAYLYTDRQVPLYQSTATFLLDPRPPPILGGEIQEVAPMGTSPWDANRAEYYNAQLQVLRSHMLAVRTVEIGKLDERKDIVGDLTDPGQRRVAAVNSVLGSIQIGGPHEDRVIHVTATHQSPEAAAAIANAHVQAYLEFNLSLRTEGASAASKWLSGELEKAAIDLRRSEMGVLDFKENNSLVYVSLEDQRNLVTANIEHYTRAVNEARVKRIEAQDHLARLKKARQQPLLQSALFDLANSQTGIGLKQEYYQAQRKLEEIAQTYGPKADGYKAQARAVAKILDALEAEADILVTTAEEKYKAALANEHAFETEVEHQKKLAFELGPKEVDYNRLVRQEKSDEERYRVVLDQLRNSQITGRLNTVNVRSLDPARVPAAPIFPRLGRNVMYASGFAALFGAGLILLLTFLDRRITSPDEIEATVKAPLLGVIPKAQGEDTCDPLDLLVHEKPTSIIAEACRNLRTNLLYAGANRPIRTLVLTSPHEREGKTTAAMYLSTVIAQSNQRVVLVDSDLRRPRLARANGVPTKHGLSDAMMGGVELDDIIKTTDVPNLYLVPAGPPPPNPSELLMTERFQHLLAELAERFDMVVLDSPPVLAVTDASILARHADATLLLVKAEQTGREAARRAADQLRTVDARMAGVVLNALDLRKRVYGYHYGFGYGYAYAPKPAEG